MANPLLALQVQPPSIDVAGSLGRGQELKTMALSNALNEYRLKQAHAADERSNRLAQLYGEIGPGLASGEDAAINRLAMVDPTAAQGFRKEALGMQKTQGDIQFDKLKLSGEQIKQGIERAEFIGRSANSILGAPPATRPLLYQSALEQAKQLGIDTSGAPPEYSDQAVAAMRDQAISVKDQLDLRLRQDTQAETARHNKASEGIQIRGQNLTDARAREAANKPKEAPSGYRFKADGNLEVIPGGPADTTGMRGKATDAQRITALYADRAAESDRILSGVGKEGDKGYVPGVEDQLSDFYARNRRSIPVIGNYLVGEEFQKAEQAQRDFINAVLRKESGAVIGADEFENAKQQYFPQPGDSDAVKKQKRANRQTAIAGLRRAAGSAIEQESGGVIDFNDLPDGP